MLWCATRLEERGPYLHIGMALLSPAKPREVSQDACLVYLCREIRSQPPASRVGAIEDEMGHALRMPGCVLDRDGAAPAGPHHGKPPEVRRLNHTVEIAHPGLERKIAGVPVRKPAAAGVMAQYFMLAGEDIEPWSPCKAAPLMLEMGEPSRRHHQRGAFAADCISELRVIPRRAKSDVLMHKLAPLGHVHCTAVRRSLHQLLPTGRCATGLYIPPRDACEVSGKPGVEAHCMSGAGPTLTFDDVRFRAGAGG